jgi:hypothetical protein
LFLRFRLIALVGEGWCQSSVTLPTYQDLLSLKKYLP